MNIRKIRYTLGSGKNNKLLYYIREYAKLSVPRPLMTWWRRRLLAAAKQRNDYEYIMDRVDYYNKLSPALASATSHEAWQEKSVDVGSQPMMRQKVYYLDSMEYARSFDPACRWHVLSGDITHVDNVPTIVKSRPISGDNANSVLLKLNKIRHFIFVDDHTPFMEKKDMAVFRGKVNGKAVRMLFMEKYHGNPRFDTGAIDRDARADWKSEKMSISEHLKYRFILALEGNDVASNLKWIMSSNSLAMMPKPTYETWFMEGKLKGGYHYVEVKPDLSDLEEKMNYYSAHPSEAEAIIAHANEYVAQFRNKRREDIISLMVLEKYFRIVKGL